MDYTGNKTTISLSLFYLFRGWYLLLEKHFYNTDVNTKTAALDIKLLPIVQGKGIAPEALLYAIDKAFEEGKS